MENELERNKEIGERLGKIRVSKGATQQQAANELDCSRGTIVNYESNKTEKIPATAVQRYCEVYGSTYDYILGGNEQSDSDSALHSLIKSFSPLQKKHARDFICEVLEKLKD